jgi:hypothetical protein
MNEFTFFSVEECHSVIILNGRLTILMEKRNWHKIGQAKGNV